MLFLQNVIYNARRSSFKTVLFIFRLDYPIDFDKLFDWYSFKAIIAELKRYALNENLCEDKALQTIIDSSTEIWDKCRVDIDNEIFDLFDDDQSSYTLTVG